MRLTEITWTTCHQVSSVVSTKEFKFYMRKDSLKNGHVQL